MLEHIIHQANHQQNQYIFILSCLNYALLPIVKKPDYHATKVLDTLKQMSITVQGPIWNNLIRACEK